ncbi:MFS transporter [Candidatus Woesebacteria bacterium]|nr:MFS transporter [Candidatus Woesebacteria bacterium]
MKVANNRQMMTIFLVVFIDLLGFGIILPLLPYIAEKYAATPLMIGLLSGAYSLFQFIAGPILGRLSDRYGRKKLLIISQLGSMAGYVLLALAGSLPLLFISRIIDGITGGNISIAQAYMADVTTKETRAKGMGLLGAAFGIGFMFGPAIGGYLSKYGFAAPALFAAGISALSTVATTLFLTETVNVKKAKESPRTAMTFTELKRVLKTPPISTLLIIFFLLSLGFSGMQGTYALFVQAKFGWGPTQVGYIFALIGIVAIITQIRVLSFATSNFGEYKTLVWSVLILAMGFGLIGATSYLPLFIIGNALIPLGNSLANPTLTAIATESIPPAEYGETLGLLQSSGSLGRIFGPVAAGAIYSFGGHNSPMIVSAMIFVAISVLVIPQLKKSHT